MSPGMFCLCSKITLHHLSSITIALAGAELNSSSRLSMLEVQSALVAAQARAGLSPGDSVYL